MTWSEPDGEPIDPKALEYDGARQLREALNRHPFGRLVEVRARQGGGGRKEVVVVELEPELPQDLVYDIRSVERLGVVFDGAGRRCPEVLALRDDFPQVPHLNWTPAGHPKNLCLYEDRWSEVRLGWTGAGFLRHLVQWLSRTATGELHGADQVLEPFLFESANVLVFPETVFDGGEAEKSFAGLVVQQREGWPCTLKLLDMGEEEPPEEIPRMYCVAVEGEATAPGAMRDGPENLMELSRVLDDVGVDLWESLGARLKFWYSGERRPRDGDGVVVIVRLPRRREACGPVEAVDHLAFEMQPIREVGLACGTVGAEGATQPLRPLAGGTVDEGMARLVRVVPMRPIKCLDRGTSRRVSGLDPDANEPRIVLVGVGALGSQIHGNLSRMGWGRWTLIDGDTLLPHNVARHRLGEHLVGLCKVTGAGVMSGQETPHNVVEQVFATDAQAVEGNEPMLSAYREADWIVDASTSIAASRFLARDLDSRARRVSLFLNPDGCDVVMLLEDAARSMQLDVLEAQYYRAVLCDQRLEKHIQKKRGVRFSGGCRDVTARLAQDDVAFAGGLLSRQIRTAGEEAAIAVWQREADGSVSRINVPVCEPTSREGNGWGFMLDADVLAKAECLRMKALPKETGGVLIGYFDVPRRCIYVVDALPPPPDSIEHETAFIRGYDGLQDDLDRVKERTGGQVTYVGEWHSHPDGADVDMSDDDKVLLATISGEVAADGWPGVVMIVGGKGRVGFHTRTVV